MGSILLFFLIVAIYFFPSYVGYRHRNANAICILNLFLGWTLIGWVVALIWANTKDKSSNYQFSTPIIPPIPQIIIEERNSQQYQNSIRVYLAGSHLTTRKNYILKNGWDTMPVDLEPEPNNKFDKNAIAVKHEGKLIGYIPEDKTHLVHPILNMDYESRFDSMDEEESYSNPGSTHLTVYLRISYNEPIPA